MTGRIPRTEAQVERCVQWTVDQVFELVERGRDSYFGPFGQDDSQPYHRARCLIVNANQVGGDKALMMISDRISPHLDDDAFEHWWELVYRVAEDRLRIARELAETPKAWKTNGEARP